MKRRKKQVPPAFEDDGAAIPSGSLRLTPSGEAKEREAQADIDAGRVRSFSSAEELLAHLDEEDD